MEKYTLNTLATLYQYLHAAQAWRVELKIFKITETVDDRGKRIASGYRDIYYPYF